MIRKIVEIILLTIFVLAFLAPLIGFFLDYKRDKKLFLKGLKDAAEMLSHFVTRLFR